MSAHAQQASHYSAVRNRLWNAKPKAKVEPQRPKPQPLLLLRDFDEHVRAWHRWKLFSETIARTAAIAAFKTNGSAAGQLAPSPYEATFTISDNAAHLFSPRRSVQDICLEVLQDFPGVSLAEVRGAHRTRHIVDARQACMYAVKVEREDLSYPVIGKWFGGRDHTTVMHSVNKIKAQREKERA